MTFSNKNQTNYQFEYSIYVNNLEQKVWDYLTDVSRWKEWDTELLDSNLSGSFNTGTKGTLTPKKGPKLKFYISEIVPNSSYSFVTNMPIGSLLIKRTIEQCGDQIKFTDDIRFTGILRRLYGLLLGRNFKSVLPEVMARFKEFAEKE